MDEQTHELFCDTYREQYFYVLRRAQAMLGDREIANDLAQDVFYKAILALERGNREVLQAGYLMRMATNLCIDHLRGRKSRQTVLLDDELLGVGGAHDGWPSADRQVLFHELLTALPASLREIAVYRLVDGSELDEIASLMRIPRRTLQRRLDRIKKRLTTLLRR